MLRFLLTVFIIPLLISSQLTILPACASQPTEYPPMGLTPTNWIITDEYNGNVLTYLAQNNNLSSNFATIASNPSTGTAGFMIDLGTPTVVDRVYLTGPTTSEGQSTNDGNPANWTSPSGSTVNIVASSGVVTGLPTIAAAGTGYSVGEELNIAQASSSGGIITVQAVNTSGGITQISLTAGGSGYTTDTAVATDVIPQAMIRVYVGNTKPTTANAESMVPYDAGNPVDTEADLRFQPTVGRYIWVELQTANIRWINYLYWFNGSTIPTSAVILPWNVGEVEVHGFAGQSSLPNVDAVVLPTAAWNALVNYTPYITTQLPGICGQTTCNPLQTTYQRYLPLILAAQELSYYLGKLTSNPVPIIPDPPPAGYTGFTKSSYSGNLYTIQDLQPLTINPTTHLSDYATMISQEQSGNLPSDISVTQNSNVIQFSGWPYRNVLKSVWTFLAAQGIHWVFPTPHGDYIPLAGSVNLSILPLSGSSVSLSGTTPPKIVLANYPISNFEPVTSGLVPVRQGYFNLLRAGWNSSWNIPIELGRFEIPQPVKTSTTISSTPPEQDYSTGFGVQSGDFGNVIPMDVLQASPFADDTIQQSWCGYLSSSNSYVCSTGSSPTFNMTDPDLINWVANKTEAYAAYAPADTSFTTIPFTGYNIIPNDSSSYDQSQDTINANSASATSNVPISNPVPWVKGNYSSQSGSYFNFINQVATKVATYYQQNNLGTPPIIGALAYSDYFLPPPSWLVSTWASNIYLAVCQYGSPNLPISTAVTAVSPNYAFKQTMDAWGALSKQYGFQLGIWDYSLMHNDYPQTNPQLPVPMVNGIVDHAQYLAKMNALNGGSQDYLPTSYLYNPWNFYAYPRIRQNTTLTTSQIENEFFTSYFKGAATPMLSYYQAMENWQLQNNVNMHFGGYADGITPGSFPIPVLSQMYTNLQAAQTAAASAPWFVQQRVANIVAGFNWLLSALKLTTANLSTPSQYQMIGQNGSPVNINLQNGIVPNYPLPNMVSQQNNGSSQGVVKLGSNYTWTLFGNTTIYMPLNIAQAGRYEIDVQANQQTWDNNTSGTGSWIFPQSANIYLGPLFVGTFSFINPTFSTTTFSMIASIPNSFIGVQNLLAYSGNQSDAIITNISITYLGPLWGDVDGDGQITSNDALETAEDAIGLSVSGFDSSMADVGLQDRITIYDAYLINQYAKGYINTFPVESDD